jgi:hypothetical protein
MTDLQAWEQDGREMGWTMPAAPRWKRLPVIRRVRAIFLAIKVHRHNAIHTSRGAIISGYDQWVLWGIAHGMEGDL